MDCKGEIKVDGMTTSYMDTEANMKMKIHMELNRKSENIALKQEATRQDTGNIQLHWIYVKLLLIDFVSYK